jgi:hypothetical protein
MKLSRLRPRFCSEFCDSTRRGSTCRLICECGVCANCARSGVNIGVKFLEGTSGEDMVLLLVPNVLGEDSGACGIVLTFEFESAGRGVVVFMERAASGEEGGLKQDCEEGFVIVNMAPLCNFAILQACR